MKKIGILGSTGSIGTQTLDIVRKEKDLEVVSLAAGSNVTLLEEQIREFQPKLAALWDEKAAADLRVRVSDLPVRIVSGMDGLVEVSTAAAGHRHCGYDRDQAYHCGHRGREGYCSCKQGDACDGGAYHYAVGRGKRGVHPACGQRAQRYFPVPARGEAVAGGEDTAHGLRRAVSWKNKGRARGYDGGGRVEASELVHGEKGDY